MDHETFTNFIHKQLKLFVQRHIASAMVRDSTALRCRVEASGVLGFRRRTRKNIWCLNIKCFGFRGRHQMLRHQMFGGSDIDVDTSTAYRNTVGGDGDGIDQGFCSAWGAQAHHHCAGDADAQSRRAFRGT